MGPRDKDQSATTRRALSRLAVMTVSVFLLGVVLMSVSDVRAAIDMALGRRIYDGDEAITARMVGHNAPLASAAIKCIACHAAAVNKSLEKSLGPALTLAFLTTPQSRRGGPPFVYNQASLCTTIRTGVDPQFITLQRLMPRFDIDDRQCAVLWAYLTRTSSNE